MSSVKIHSSVFITLANDGILEASVDTINLPKGEGEVAWHLVRIAAESRELKFLEPVFSRLDNTVDSEVTTDGTGEIELNGDKVVVKLHNPGLQEARSFDYFLRLSVAGIRWRHDPSIVVLPDPSSP